MRVELYRNGDIAPVLSASKAENTYFYLAFNCLL